MRQLGKYSFGIGDRFAHQAKAQLSALIQANENGADLTPVWNKSYREHTTIKSQPVQTRTQADLAVKELNWQASYFVDADHIGLKTVDFFLDTSDFFTLDVADFIGETASRADIDTFVQANKKFIGTLLLPGIGEKFEVTEELIVQIASKYLFAVKEAAKIYQHISQKKAGQTYVIEISMDETDEAQSPIELFFILSAIAAEKIPVQTIAPKFSGRFNKGVDYVGDLELFKTEFEQDIAVIKLAIEKFRLPSNLKLSVHSGSDKFSIYPVIREAIQKFDVGLHIKTAGTTWLEEVIGLAEAGGEGLALAKQIYEKSMARFDELTAPYATVLDIDKAHLPTIDEVAKWDSAQFLAALRHDQANPSYNLHFRQLIHVGYKIAGEMGKTYLDALEKYEEVIAKNVTYNIFERHVKPLFL